MDLIVEVRELDPEGPSKKGALIAACPIRSWDKRYDSPQVDIELPEGFKLPEETIHVVLYLGDTYFGHLLLGPSGFESDPEARHESPYFHVNTDPQEDREFPPSESSIEIYTPPACVVCGDRAISTAGGIPVCNKHHHEYIEEAKKMLPLDQRVVWRRILLCQHCPGMADTITK